MRRFIPCFIVLIFLLSSCIEQKPAPKGDEQRMSFLLNYKIIIDDGRPYYNSENIIPTIFDTTWEIRNAFSKNTLKDDLNSYKGSQCMVYMYPIKSMPFIIKKDSSIESRAVLIESKNKVVCSYIEFISELRNLPPVSLDGKSLVELSGIKWEVWRDSIDSDDNKKLVIWQYYDALRTGNYESAYSYIYDKINIKKDDFIKAAKGNSLANIDFLDIDQYKNAAGDECYFIIKTQVVDDKNSSKKKNYEILFDLKKDPASKDYGGWKVYKTKMK